VTIDAASAVLVNGVSTELANGRRVKVTGSVSGRKLIAAKIEFLAQ
jgi:hypothetical protein